MTARAFPRAWRLPRDIAWLLAGLLALLAWEASGWDLVTARWVGGASGFAWREAWWARVLLHDGGRWLSLALLALLAWDAARPLLHGPSRRERTYWLMVVIACALAVPALKQASATSLPWDLAEFGGHAPYVPHWLLGRIDGGPGHCFPSGHAVSAFAFLGTAFLWRPHRPALSRRLLIVIALMGALYGATQYLRGAHFISHTLWSAWLCAAMALCARRVAYIGMRAAAATSSEPSPRASASSNSAASAGVTNRSTPPRCASSIISRRSLRAIASSNDAGV